MTDTLQLLERHAEGLDVEVNFLPTMGMLVLRCATPDCPEGMSTSVPEERVRDAFEHPMVYLCDSQVERLFPKNTSDPE